MKSLLVIATALAATANLFAAGLDDVKSAAQKLAASDNYSWTQSMESTQFSPPPSHGKTEKGGFTYMKFAMRDNTVEAYVKGGKGAIKTEDGWQSLDEAANASGDNGRFRFMARRMQALKVPAAEAEDLATKSKELTKTEGVYAGDLTEEGAKSLLAFGGRRGGQAPEPRNAKGTVKFWIKDGVLTKYQYKVQGTVTFNGEDRDVDRTTTVEIQDVGATKVTVPDEAKGKIS
jgi:hypothetical protein